VKHLWPGDHHLDADSEAPFMTPPNSHMHALQPELDPIPPHMLDHATTTNLQANNWNHAEMDNNENMNDKPALTKMSGSSMTVLPPNVFMAHILPPLCLPQLIHPQAVKLDPKSHNATTMNNNGNDADLEDNKNVDNNPVPDMVHVFWCFVPINLPINRMLSLT
jgi:hypothetical protein